MESNYDREITRALQKMKDTYGEQSNGKDKKKYIPVDVRFHVDEQCALIQTMINDLDLHSRGSPFINSTFHLWRTVGYRTVMNSVKHQEPKVRTICKQHFYECVELELFPKFLRKIFLHYQYLLKQDMRTYLPHDTDFSSLENERDYTLLLAEMANWLTELDLFYDLIKRAEVYGILEEHVEKSHHELAESLKEKCGVDAFSFKHLSHSMFRWCSRKVITFVGTASYWGGTYVTARAPESTLYGMFGMVSFVMGRRTFPWTSLVSMQRVMCMMAGYATSYLCKNVNMQIEKSQVREELREILDKFRIITTNLSNVNISVSELMTSCINSDDYKQYLEIKERLQKRLRVVFEETQLMKDIPKKAMIGEDWDPKYFELLLVEDDEWVSVDIKEVHEKGSDHDFVVISEKKSLNPTPDSL